MSNIKLFVFAFAMNTITYLYYIFLFDIDSRMFQGRFELLVTVWKLRKKKLFFLPILISYISAQFIQIKLNFLMRALFLKRFSLFG